MVAGQHVVVLGGHHHFAHIFGLDLFAADDGGDFGHLVVELVEGFADFLALGATGFVAKNGFVFRFREYENAVVHFCNVLVV